MRPIKVNGGIFIDWGCSSVKNLPEGWLIPVDCQPYTVKEEFNQELEAFIRKWFTPVSGSISPVSEGNQPLD